MEKPRLRPVRGFPAKAKAPDGTEHDMLGLSDARQVSDKVVFTIPAAQLILPLMDGSRSVDQIVTEVGRGLQRPLVEQLVAQLDEAGLLEGPTFQGMLAKMRADFDASPILPPASTAAFAEQLVEFNPDGTPIEEKVTLEEQGKRMASLFDQWIAEALKNESEPALTALPKAIVAPHLDYPRGWLNYAHAYGRLRVADRPDRVIILGTNHFGEATGIAACDKGYQTPLGTCQADQAAIDALRSRLGDKLFDNRYDHEREHSIELQVPWVQHAFGKNDAGEFPRVVGILVHDPAVKNGESYDGKGVDLLPFVEALRDTIASLPGRTLVVASADLSHVGPAFGDQRPMVGDDPDTDAARRKVFDHDREMLQLIAQNKPSDLMASMAWQQNPTRWCSTGNLVATLLAVKPESVKILNYAAAMDQQGMAMVSSAALLMN
jgi:hypothetical protein